MSRPGEKIRIDVSRFGDEVGNWVLSKVGAGGVYNVERSVDPESNTLGGYSLTSVHRADGAPVEHVPRVIGQILVGSALQATAESGGISQLGADFELVQPSEARRLEQARNGDPLKSLSRYEFEALSPAEKVKAMASGIQLYD